MKQILSIIFILFSMATVLANPADDLLERIDKGASAKFKTTLVKSDKDFFEISQDGKRIAVKANSWVNMATGINWYLKHYAGIHLSWNGMSHRLPDVLPPVAAPERHDTDLSLRYNFNYCTFSYSMPFWDWNRWEKEIDWMALHGINMPLAIVGMESAWRNMLIKLGYSDKEVGEFISGPAFLAWWAMNNLEGWGGPLPDSWYDRQEKLQKKILRRMKELGMKPVLPGYCGMMPHDAKERLGLDVSDGGTWNGYVRPSNLSATDARFDEIADLYYKELTALYGKAEYYSLDPFHESKDDASIDYAAAGAKLMAAMKRANPNAVWVVQGWTENPRPEMIEPMEQGDILILDLFSECRPMWGIPSVWRRVNGYGKHQWLFCMLENFGANVGLHGRMDQLIDNFYQTKDNHLAMNIKGFGFSMEGSGNNPVMFELMSELPWRQNRVSKEVWIKDYVKARYGMEDPAVTEAWEILSNSIYNCPAGNNQQGPHESIFCGRPSLNNFQVKSWSKMRNYYDPASTLKAASLMASVADRYRGNNNFEYDLVDFVRQALADQGRRQYLATIADYNSFSQDSFRKNADKFLEMLLLQDRLLGTRKEFRLGTWTEAARDAGISPDEKDLYEWNARVQITTWGNRTCADQGGLRDYANKEWNGLLRDFYYPRWKTYFDALAEQMHRNSLPDTDALGSGPNSNKTATELFAMALPSGPEIDWYALEEPWTLKKGGYTSSPEGDPIAIAKEVMEFLNE
ncbi:MAG: alpha-N-acetylglucosaminidase [Muribaculaceae bacterium]|nr:alpha-N-acetylglucosaminidase [Muribaculaceae bacterium]